MNNKELAKFLRADKFPKKVKINDNWEEGEEEMLTLPHDLSKLFLLTVSKGTLKKLETV